MAREDHAPVLDGVADLIARPDAQGLAHRFGHEGLALYAEAGRHEPAAGCSFFTHGRKFILRGGKIKAGTPAQPPSFFFSTSLTSWGLAWPCVAFITWPTNQPKTLGLPWSLAT